MYERMHRCFNCKFEHFICLIKCAFVGEKNFNIIKMHGTTIKKNYILLTFSTGCLSQSEYTLNQGEYSGLQQCKDHIICQLGFLTVVHLGVLAPGVSKQNGHA
jgi:hypothetical protein